jgi:homocysteine S-methyltransferase
VQRWRDIYPWLAAAKLIGGCCRTTPKDIAELNARR